MPWIQVPDVAAEVDKAIAAVDDRTAPGSARVVAYIEKPGDGGMDAIRKQLRLPVIDEIPGGFTVEGANKARVTILVAPERGEIVITGVPTKTKPPGPCVPVPDVKHEVYLEGGAVNQDGEYHESTIHWDLETHHTIDVDGDGLLDFLVPVPPRKTACPEELSWRVYVRRGACGHDLGVVGPGSLVADSEQVPLDRSGFRPLTLSAESSKIGEEKLPVMTTITRSFAVVKGRYKQTSQSKQSGICHHCATWWCRAP